MSKGTVNKVILLGRIGSDPEIKYMPSGVSVTNISLATNDSYKDKKTGQIIDATEWHRVAVFGQQAENVGQYCQKGSLLYVEGRIRTNRWKDQSGQDRTSTEIVAITTQFIGGKSNRGNNPTAEDSLNEENQVKEDFSDDDLPF